jgi:hypothetical protein
MFFNRSKSKKQEIKSFYIGNIPTRTGRRQINLDNPIKNNISEVINPRIGEFKTTSGYHPVRPAIMISDEVRKESAHIKPSNTNHIILNSSKILNNRFLHRKKKF